MTIPTLVGRGGLSCALLWEEGTAHRITGSHQPAACLSQTGLEGGSKSRWLCWGRRVILCTVGGGGTVLSIAPPYSCMLAGRVPRWDWGRAGKSLYLYRIWGGGASHITYARARVEVGASDIAHVGVRGVGAC